MFDKFFDALNVSNYNSGVKDLSATIQVFTCDDFRLKVSRNFVLTICLCACYLTVVER